MNGVTKTHNSYIPLTKLLQQAREEEEEEEEVEEGLELGKTST